MSNPLEPSLYHVYRETRKNKRAENRKHSRNLLESKKIPMEVMNEGAHIKIPAGDSHIDFWPGTGLWIDRGTRKQGRGVYPLLNYYDRIIGVPVTSGG